MIQLAKGQTTPDFVVGICNEGDCRNMRIVITALMVLIDATYDNEDVKRMLLNSALKNVQECISELEAEGVK